MLPFGVTIPATVPQGSEIPEGLTKNPVFMYVMKANIIVNNILICTITVNTWGR
jgi:hypothetical protein